jgi:hypothetical protein
MTDESAPEIAARTTGNTPNRRELPPLSSAFRAAIGLPPKRRWSTLENIKQSHIQPVLDGEPAVAPPRRPLEYHDQPSDNAGDLFVQNVARRQKDRWAVERSIVINQVGQTTFAARRQKELTDKDAGYLAELYGIRTADPLRPVRERKALRLENTLSSHYQRGTATREAEEKYEQLLKKSDIPLTKATTVFVHSEQAVERLRNRLALDGQTDIVSSTHRLSPGVIAVAMATEDAAKLARGMISQIGATPSNYELVRGERRYVPKRAPSDSTLDNNVLLSQLTGGEGRDAKAVYASIPLDHPMRATATSALSLVQGLQTTFSDGYTDIETFRQSALIADSLGTLKGLMLASRSMTEDSERFFSVYQAMMDEIFIVLAAARPYDGDSFHQASSNALDARTGGLVSKLKIAEPSSYLVSSGMEAITIGLEAARTLCRTRDARFLSDKPRPDLPDYFEVPGLFEDGQSEGSRVLVSVLNPSTPRQRVGAPETEIWNAQTLVAKLRERLEQHSPDDEPLALVLDASVETPGADGISSLHTVLSDLRVNIENGALRIVLCKSYQKYPSLSSGKMMAGTVTILGKQDDRTKAAQELCQSAEADLDWIKNDDAQLLTHFVQYGSKSELELITNAAKNATVISEILSRGKGEGFDRHQDGLPFGIIENTDDQLVAPECHLTKQLDIASLILDSTEARMSFGFLETTAGQFRLNDSMVVRVAAGQESRAELIEKFYGLASILEKRGHVGHAGTGHAVVSLRSKELTDEAEQIARDAANIIIEDVEPEKWAGAAWRIVRERQPAEKPDESTPAKFLKILTAMLFACTGKRRQSHSNQDLESLIYSVLRRSESAADPELLARLREDLRKLLKAELNRYVTPPGQEMSDNLALVASAFAPVLSDADRSGPDPDIQRLSIKRDPAGLGEPTSKRYQQTRYASNMVASVLKVITLVFGPQDLEVEHRAAVQQTYTAMIHAGLPGVSPSLRNDIVMAWLRLQQLTLTEQVANYDTAGQDRTVHEMVRQSRGIEHREDLAGMLQSLGEANFERLSSENRTRLVTAWFGPLDVESRSVLIQALTAEKAFDKVDACLDVVAGQLKNSSGVLILSSEQVGQGLEPGDFPRELTASEMDTVETDLLKALFTSKPKSAPRGFDGLVRRSCSKLLGSRKDIGSPAQLALIVDAITAIARDCVMLGTTAGSEKEEEIRLSIIAKAADLPNPYRPIVQPVLDALNEPSDQLKFG